MQSYDTGNKNIACWLSLLFSQDLRITTAFPLSLLAMIG